MVVVYQQDGVWYAKSVQVTGDGSGAGEYETISVSGDGEGNATVKQDSGGFARRAGPHRNR